MKRLLFIALLICVHSPEQVRTFPPALSCVGRHQGPPCEEFWRADAVFIGTAKKVVTVPFASGSWVPHWQEYQKLTATLTVEETFRGNVGSEITFERADCYYPFKQGETYLVYAFKGEGGKLDLATSVTRTRPISEAGEDLAYIRGLPHAPEGGRIFGKVWNHISSFALRVNNEPLYPSAPFSEVKIVASGSGQNYETTTDAEGNFEFLGLPQGDYSLSVVLPNYLSGREEKVRLVDRACAPVRFSIQATGIIAGRVLDAKGQPLPSVPVSIFSADGVTGEMIDRVKRGYVTSTTTNEHGQFRFERVPSGRYVIAVNLVKEVTNVDERISNFPRTFYPGVTNFLNAGTVTLGNGQEKRDIELKVHTGASRPESNGRPLAPNTEKPEHSPSPRLSL